MKRLRRTLGVVRLGILTAVLTANLLGPIPVGAQAVALLSIEQLKVTADDQFVTLKNLTTDPLDISSFELIYLNAENKPSKTFTFSGSINPGSYYVMSDTQLTACFAMQVDSVSLGFSTTGGTLQLWRYTDAHTKVLESSVAWIKTRKTDTPAATVTLPTSTTAFLQRQMPVPPDNKTWITVQPSQADPCQLESMLEPELMASEEFLLLPGTMPPVSFVAAPSSGSAKVNRNPGLMAPVINELLPNPASPQTDADDEFIELYNPNDTVFDLTGFKLAFGSNNPRKYTFPEGSVLQPKEFKAFTSGDTSISLSNTQAQVWLLDPNEKVIGQSQPYSSAKDGQAWAFNNGTWSWTAVPTPNAMNAITPVTVAGTNGKTTAAVLGISDNAGSSGAASTVASTANATQLEDAAPLHPGILAGVGVLAIGYAVYEYRHDMANRLFQFRRYLRNRRALR